MSALLRFYPWLQKGLSQAIVSVADENGAPQESSAAISVGVRVGGVAAPVTQEILLRGPGDVTGLESAQIIRVVPAANARDFEPNYFPYLELTSPELPWLFTPAVPGLSGRLRPWLALVALESEGDYTLTPPTSKTTGLLSIDSGAGGMLPSLAEAHAWAHVQVADPSGSSADIEDVLASSRSDCVARLICPARLKVNTAYTVCLVPTFEAGRLAGLGLDSTAAGVADAWSEASTRLDLPVYYSWSFSTGDADIETLVRRLQPWPAGADVGLHDLDIAHPRGGLDIADLGETFAGTEEVPVSFKGVFLSPIAESREWETTHRDAFQDALGELLTVAVSLPAEGEGYDPLRDDPVIAPPVYGSWQTGIAGDVPDDAAWPVWMQEMNLDPVTRSVAGAGVETIRTDQESLMAEAWEYARNARTAQRMLRQSRLALHVSTRLQDRLQQMEDENWLQLTSPTHTRVASSQRSTTVGAQIRQSELVPSGAIGGGFRRFGTQQQKKVKTDADAPETMVREVTSACISASPMITSLAYPTPSVSISYEKRYEVSETEAASPTRRTTSPRTRSTTSRRTARSAALSATMASASVTSSMVFSAGTPSKTTGFAAVAAMPILGNMQVQAVASVDVDLNSVATRLRSKTQPATLLPQMVFSRIGGLTAPPSVAVPIPKFAEISFEFETPAYERLQELNPELFLPGIGAIPANSVSVLTINPDFIESYLAGLNHEMSREFAWREFPASLDQTWFRRFWDYLDNPETKDIEPIGAWEEDSTLGTHAYGFRPGAEEGRIIVLIKGDLMRLYPNLVIYAARAQWVEQEAAKSASLSIIDSVRLMQGDGWTREADLSNADNIRLPIFKGAIGSDGYFVGFDLSVEEIRGSTNRDDAIPGWFFVFEEQMAEPHFGLDAAESFTPTNPPSSINDLSWGHVAASQEELDAMAYLSLETDWRKKKIEGVTWGKDAAAMARLTYQLPVRLFMHGDALLAEEE